MSPAVLAVDTCKAPHRSLLLRSVDAPEATSAGRLVRDFREFGHGIRSNGDTHATNTRNGPHGLYYVYYKSRDRLGIKSIRLW